MRLEGWLLGIGIALVISILGSKLATRLGIPVLLLFLGLGMLAGSDGPGGIWFDDALLAQSLGVIALVFILFSGGMDLDWKQSRPHVWKAAALATIGVAVTAGVVGIAASTWMGFTLLEGLLLGAIVSSTDAAAVFSTLSRGGLALRRDLRSVVEMESGSNDPAAVFLTLLFVAMVLGQPTSAVAGVGSFAWQMLLGAAMGWCIGRVGVVTMRKLRLDFEGLYHGLSIGVVLIAFAGTSLIGGNGFLAAYVAGIAFGNGEFRQRKGLLRFHDGIAWLMQIMVFIVLGLLVFPKQLPSVALNGVVLSVVLMFVARPLGVFLSLAPFRVDWRTQLFVGWCGLRGAVPIVLATFPLLANVPRSQEFFNLVFFVVVFSTVLQGPSIPWLARRLGLVESPHRESAEPVAA